MYIHIIRIGFLVSNLVIRLLKLYKFLINSQIGKFSYRFYPWRPTHGPFEDERAAGRKNAAAGPVPSSSWFHR